MLQNVGLAVQALHALLTSLPRPDSQGPSLELSRARLMLAGGYDDRLAENREHYAELQTLVEELHLQEQVNVPFGNFDPSLLGFV